MAERVHTMSVMRTFTPLTPSDGTWAVEPVDAVVWSYTSGAPEPVIHNVSLPGNYTKGLLRTYINNRQCTLEDFDEALASLGYTRQDVEQGIRSAE